MNRNYIYNLTAIRGVAAILVALLHFHFFLGAVIPEGITGVVDKLYLMVDLFFILSGFIICYVYSDQFIKAISSTNYKNFLFARIARIYPLHVITLFAEFLIFLFILSIGKFNLLPDWHQHFYRLDGIPVQLAFLETVGIFDFATWNSPAWSLSAEWWAYVVFPILFIPIGRFKFKYVPYFFIVVIFCWIGIEFYLAPKQPFMHHPPNPNNINLDVNWHYGTLRGIVGFTAGMIVWRVYTAIKKSNLKIKYNDYLLLLIVCLSLISMHFKWYDTITVSFFSLIILSAAIGGNKMDSIFSFQLFQKLGDWSFSIYIWHMVLINLVTCYYLLFRDESIVGILKPFNDKGIYTYISLILFFIIICFVGAISYKFIEQPTRKWVRKRSGIGYEIKTKN